MVISARVILQVDYTALEGVASEKLFWIWSSNTSIVVNGLEGFVLFCGFLILIAFSNIRLLTDKAGKVLILVSVKGATKFRKKLDDLHLRPFLTLLGLIGRKQIWTRWLHYWWQ
jgi:hypothetical protein